MDEEHWLAYRRHLRERTARQGFLIIGPVVIFVALAGFVAPMDHPPGDIRDVLVFRLLAFGAFVAVAVGGIVASVRWLLADRRKGWPPSG